MPLHNTKPHHMKHHPSPALACPVAPTQCRRQAMPGLHHKGLQLEAPVHLNHGRHLAGAATTAAATLHQHQHRGQQLAQPGGGDCCQRLHLDMFAWGCGCCSGRQHAGISYTGTVAVIGSAKMSNVSATVIGKAVTTSCDRHRWEMLYVVWSANEPLLGSQNGRCLRNIHSMIGKEADSAVTRSLLQSQPCMHAAVPYTIAGSCRIQYNN